jgi:hypothetical protein
LQRPRGDTRFQFLEASTALQSGDSRFARLRDAYLEPWGPDLAEAFSLALRVGSFAHPVAWSRQREFLPPPERPTFDRAFAHIIRRALGMT